MSENQINWKEKTTELAHLLLECRDALPAITLTRAHLYKVDLRLGDRIDAALEPWKVDPDDPNGV